MDWKSEIRWIWRATKPAQSGGRNRGPLGHKEARGLTVIDGATPIETLMTSPPTGAVATAVGSWSPTNTETAGLLIFFNRKAYKCYHYRVEPEYEAIIMTLKTGPALDRKATLDYLRRKTIIDAIETGQRMIVASTKPIPNHPEHSTTQLQQGLATIDFALELIKSLPIRIDKDSSEGSA